MRRQLITDETFVEGWEERRTVAHWARLADVRSSRLCEYLNAGIEDFIRRLDEAVGGVGANQQ